MKQPNKENRADKPKDPTEESHLNSETVENETVETEELPKEYGGRKDGLNPTRYGDWEKNGRCIDF